MQANSTPTLPPRWALLVIDMQNDFLDAGGYYARKAALRQGGDWAALPSQAQSALLDDADPGRPLGLRAPELETVITGIRAALVRAREAERPVAFIRALYGRDYPLVPPSLLREPGRLHHACKAGTWGADLLGAIADEVAAANATRERVFNKHTYDAFTNPALAEFLRETGSEAVVACGTETQVCVLSSAMHAAFLGFQSFILEDCVWSADAPQADAALALFRDVYGATLTVADLDQASG